MTAIKQVRKAVIPAAGLGTRFLPATKATPKEMLPIVDKPTIQYIIEEALASGIEDILIITGRSKRAIEDHFDRSIELELNLAAGGKAQELELQLVPIRILAPANLLIDGHGPIDDAPKDVFCDMSRNALFFCHISDEMAFFHGEDLFHHQRQNGVILHEGMIFGNIDEAMTRRQPVIISLEHSKVILPDYIP